MKSDFLKTALFIAIAFGIIVAGNIKTKKDCIAAGGQVIEYNTNLGVGCIYPKK